MFKRAKRKIVVSILTILCSVLIITLGLVYFTSYLSVTSQNYETLIKHFEMLSDKKDNGPRDGFQENNKNDMLPVNGDIRGLDRMERNLKIGTFYSVKFSKNGEITVVENGADGIYNDDELITLAESVKQDDKGRKGELIYIVRENNGEIIVSFMDNTVFNENFAKLFWFTLIFGVIALIAIGFISNYIANRIVSPMEETYKKQKQFTADAGHELKTPIAAVAANTEMLRRQIGDNKWLNNIEFENERMKSLVTELLELARNENRTADKKPSNLSHLITGTILPLEAAAFEKGVIIENDIESDVVVNIDEKSIEQLVTILVDNAVSHASFEDGKQTAVNVNLSKIKGGAVLNVSNPGKAIPDTEKDKIFERFYKTDSSHEFTGHYGLGLAIAKTIADKNGAKISVSCPDGQVCFTVTFG